MYGNANRQEMLQALGARGPHPDMAATDNLFAPFAGSWDVEMFDLEGDGARRVTRGEWHFGWVLEGRAMQDVFLSPPRGERRNGMSAKGNRCATTLRIFDPASGLWRVHYFNPVDQSTDTLTARRDGREIVQLGATAQGTSLRQKFTDIAEDSFAWYRETAKSDGIWKLKAEHFAKRRV